MKRGDLVQTKQNYRANERFLGIITKVEKDFYGESRNDYLSDRLTIHWINGKTSSGPGNYVQILSEA